MRFEGHRGRLERLALGSYEQMHYGRVADHFAYAYGFTIVEGSKTVVGPKQLMGFHDDRPDCRLVLMRDNTIFYYAENTVYRFKDAEGQRGGEQLVMSEDGGKTFSENLLSQGVAIGAVAVNRLGLVFSMVSKRALCDPH